jgi:hypothetical protein
MDSACSASCAAGRPDHIELPAEVRAARRGGSCHSMCNLHATTSSQQAILELTGPCRTAPGSCHRCLSSNPMAGRL